VHDDLIDAVTDALSATAVTWAALLGTDAGLLLDERIRQAAPRIAAQLHTRGEQAGTAADLLDLLGHPGDADPGWWATVLGQTVAHALDDPGVSRAQAAQILGVSPGTVAQLTHRRALARVAGGRVSLISVLDRLAARR